MKSNAITLLLFFLSISLVESKVKDVSLNSRSIDKDNNFDVDELLLDDSNDEDTLLQKFDEETKRKINKIKAETRLKMDAIRKDTKIQLKALEDEEKDDDDNDDDESESIILYEEDEEDDNDFDDEETISSDDERFNYEMNKDNEIHKDNQDEKDVLEVGGKKELYSRIIGGNIARIGEFPFMVNFKGCGGSLVAPNLVLTAAHCAGVSTSVRIGSVYYERGGVEAYVVKEITHPLYDPYSFDYDFMILELDRDIDTAIYTPININIDSKNPRTGDMLTVAGFGSLWEGDQAGSHTLMKVDVPVVSQATCLSQYSPEFGSYAIKEEIHVCAGYSQGGKDSCQGDSGGAIFKEINGVTTQVGVVSWGLGCAQSGYSGVYARTSGVLPWLKSEICSRHDDISGLCQDWQDTGAKISVLVTPMVVAVLVILMVVAAIMIHRRKSNNLASASDSEFGYDDHEKELVFG